MSKTKNSIIFMLTILLLLSIAFNISFSKNLKDVFSYESQYLMNVGDYNNDLSNIVDGKKDNAFKNKTIYSVKEDWDNLRDFLLNCRNYSLNTNLLRKYLSKVDGTMINISENLENLLIKDINDFTKEDKDFINKYISLSKSIQENGSELRSKINFIIPVYTKFRVKDNLNSIVNTIIESKF